MLSIKVSKSSSPGGILDRVIKDFPYELADPVCHIFNKFLHAGELPDIWKDAFITPISKVPSLSCENELRQISLTACLSKTGLDKSRFLKK